MKQYTINNDTLTVCVSPHGAEIKSILANGVERMWNGNPQYWGRTAPVLFPLVGSVKDKKYSYQEMQYSMGQHGFARDSEFTFVRQTQTEIVFALRDSEETREMYPFHFLLEIRYRLEGNQLNVTWHVSNIQNTTMYFQVGGHPAFLCPLKGGERQEDYEVHVGEKNTVEVGYLQGGLLSEQTETMDSCIQLKEGLFDRDALVIEDDAIHSVELVNRKTKKTCMRVSFDTPVLGIWRPAKRGAPFVCIEPWYGRCDRVDFAGTLEEREYEQSLEPGGVFVGGYQVEFF